jgi:hypothetical protein
MMASLVGGPFSYFRRYDASDVVNFVVVPLSRAYPKHHWDLQSVVAMLLVMILFAEVIVFMATVFLGRA